MLRITGNDVKHTELTEIISNICCNLFDEKWKCYGIGWFDYYMFI